MSFSCYEEYQDSSFDWLGKIPKKWSLGKFRHLFSESSEKIESEVYGEMLSVSGYRGIEIKEYSDENQKRTDENLIGYRIVHAEQLVVNTMWLNYAGLGISQLEGHVSPAYRSYWVDPSLHTRYVHHLMRSSLYVLGYTKYLTGVRPNSLQMGREDLMSFPIVIPSYLEQKIIADFLDKETKKIDTLVAEQEKLIELLKEKRQAVISHAVTKGVEPSVKKKNSGVEWLGEVPEHWKILKIKRLSAVQRGASPRPIDDPKYFDDEGEYGWVRISDVSSSKGVLRNTEQKLSVLGSSLSVKIEPKQLFISIAGTVGKPCISAIKACIHDGFVYFPNLKINPWWLFRIFEAGVCYGGLGKLGTQLNLNTDTVGSISIGVPPDQEIESILNFIQITLEKFDGLISEAQKVIDLSLERRSTLISAAVTGQIDVRNYQPKEVA